MWSEGHLTTTTSWFPPGNPHSIKIRSCSSQHEVDTRELPGVVEGSKVLLQRGAREREVVALLRSVSGIWVERQQAATTATYLVTISLVQLFYYQNHKPRLTRLGCDLTRSARNWFVIIRTQFGRWSNGRKSVPERFGQQEEEIRTSATSQIGQSWWGKINTSIPS